MSKERDECYRQAGRRMKGGLAGAECEVWVREAEREFRGLAFVARSRDQTKIKAHLLPADLIRL